MPRDAQPQQAAGWYADDTGWMTHHYASGLREAACGWIAGGPMRKRRAITAWSARPTYSKCSSCWSIVRQRIMEEQARHSVSPQPMEDAR